LEFETRKTILWAVVGLGGPALLARPLQANETAVSLGGKKKAGSR